MTEHPLVWDDRSDDVIEARSVRPVPEPYTHGYHTIEEDNGLRPGRSAAAPAFRLTWVRTDHVDNVSGIDLGRHHTDLAAAKAAAERFEETGDPYAGAEDLRRRDFNLDAAFMPQDPREQSTRPCIEVGGVQVYAYLDERTGHLVISAHYDTAEEAVLGQDGCVPTRVSIGGHTVFEQGEGAPR